MTCWQERFLGLAAHIAQWSKDPSTKCGCIVVRPDKTIASTGFNGYPQGIKDEKLDIRGYKLERIIHAEMNALLFLRERPVGYTAYVWPMMPCNRCAVHIVQAGISQVIAPIYYGERWKSAIEITRSLFNEAGVAYAEIYTNLHDNPLGAGGLPPREQQIGAENGQAAPRSRP